jgi:hypothetical protein
MLRQVLWPPVVMSALPSPRPEEKQAPGDPRREVVQRASLAQLLLVARLRARNRRDLAMDSLERAAQMMLVTCKNWFSLSAKQPESTDAVPLPQPKESTDAHRNH